LTVYRRRGLADLHYPDAVYHPKDRYLYNRSFHAGYGRSGHLVVGLRHSPTCGIFVWGQHVTLCHDVNHSLHRHVMPLSGVALLVVKTHVSFQTLYEHLYLVRRPSLPNCFEDDILLPVHKLITAVVLSRPCPF